MKKNFLFGALALMLAGFWFGGASLANESGSVDCRKADGATSCAGSDYGTYDVSIDGNTIRFSNLNLSYPSDEIDRPATAGWVGVKFIATGNNLYFGGASFEGIENDSGTLDNGDVYVYEWFGITATGAKNRLGRGENEVKFAYEITGDNNLSIQFNVIIDLTKITFKSGDNIDFQVEGGKVIKYNGKSTSWEIDCWKRPGTTVCNSDMGEYSGEVSEDKQTITFSNIKLNYPKNKDNNDNRPHSGYAGFFGAKIIASSLVNDANSGSATRGNYTISDYESNEKDGEGRIVTYWWPNLTTGDIVNLLNEGKTEKTFELPVAWTGIDSANEILKVKVNIENIAFYNSDNLSETIDEGKIDFKVENGVITKIDGEDVVKVTFDGANEQVIASGTNAQKPADPTKDCNSFDGWYNGEEKFDFATLITGNLALTSKWTYTCSRSSGGGGSSKTSSKDDTKVTTGDNTKVDDKKSEEEKATDGTDAEGENVGEGNENDNVSYPIITKEDMNNYEPEQLLAYKWAYDNGITTMKTVAEARLGEGLTRAELAKMMVVYMAKIAKKSPVVTGTVSYPDVKSEELGDLAGYIQLAYQFQIMGIDANGKPIDEFNPNGLVTRGEYATVFSRVLFGSLFNQEGEDFYSKHIAALNAAGILTNTDPTIQEMRGWVMLMMYRSSQNLEEIAKVAAEIGATDEEVEAGKKAAEILAEEEAKAQATTGDVAEAPVAEEQAQATTGDVAEAPAVEETASAEANTGEVAAEPSNN